MASFLLQIKYGTYFFAEPTCGTGCGINNRIAEPFLIFLHGDTVGRTRGITGVASGTKGLVRQIHFYHSLFSIFSKTYFLNTAGRYG
jgi:hypothetical protein